MQGGEVNLLNEKRIFSYADVIYSCFLPEDELVEFRLPVSALVYVYSGVMEAEFGSKKLKIEAGNYVFLQRDHRLKLSKHAQGDKPYKAISIRLQRNFLRQCFADLPSRLIPTDAKRFRDAVIVLDNKPDIQSLFLSLFPYTDNRIEPREEIIKLKMREAVDCLLNLNEKFYPTLFDFSTYWKIDLLGFMEKNFTQNMSMKEFANYTGRSLATFKRDFSKISDLTPEKWLLQKRLDKAYDLLKSGESTPSCVYAEVGFKNRSHFALAFRKHFGMTPSSVKNSIN